MDMSPPGRKGLGPRNIAQGLGPGFTRVLPWAPKNRPPGPWPGPGWGLGWPGAGLAYNARARNESKEN
jgi:hypothetical protein